MLAKQYRLLDTSVYKKVEKEGRVFQSANFGIAYLKRKEGGPSKFGFVASTKISKEAVDRNTIKRHMSETVRMQIPYIKEGYDVIFLAKTTIIRIPADGIKREVRQAIRGAGLMK